MLVRSSILLLAVILSTACGAPPEEEAPPPPVPVVQQPASTPPVTLGDIWSCHVFAQGAGFDHDVYRYTDGSTFSSCEIADGWNTYSSVSLFKATHAGAVSGSCLLTADWDSSPTAGWWKFSFNGTSSTATYSDSSSSYNGLTVTLSCTKS